MKIMRLVKKRKIMVVICCTAALIAGVCLCAGAWPEPAQAGLAAKKTESQEGGESRADVQEEKAVSASGQQTGNKAEQGQSAKGRTESASSTNKAATASASSSKSQNSNKNYSGSENSEKAGTAGKPQAAHQHEWKAIEAVQEVEEKVPVYGDKCNTCHKNITGFAEEHILSTDCMGYSTDVVVGYECRRGQTLTIAGNSCSCGASK